LNIAWLIPCRYVEVHDNLGTIVGAGVDTFWLEQLPSAIQVMLAIRLVGLPEEFTPEVEYRTATRIKDPSGEIMSEVSGGARIGADSARPDYLVGVTMPIAVGFEVAEEGTYAIEFEFGEAWSSIPIRVVQGVP